MTDAFPVLVRSVDRAARLRTSILRKLLSGHRYDFHAYDRLAAIVGDDIGDQIRLLGRYEDNALQVMKDLVLPHIQTNKLYCLDVGANIGNHTLFFRSCFLGVIAVEPNPLARALLEFNLRVNGADNVVVKSVGLSDNEGTAKLAVCRDNLGASRLQRIAAADKNFAARISEEIEVDIVTGDSILNPDTPIGLIKIDVEGLESEVLHGLARTIRSNRPVIMLEQLASAVDGSTGRTTATAFLEEFGYQSFEIRPLHRSRIRRFDALLTYLYGNVRYAFRPVDRLEKRNYPNLFCLPDDVASRIE